MCPLLLPSLFRSNFLLPALGIMPILPSAAICPPLDLILHRYFLPLYPPQPRQLFFLLVSWLLAVWGVWVELVARDVVDFFAAAVEALRVVACFVLKVVVLSAKRYVGRRDITRT